MKKILLMAQCFIVFTACAQSVSQQLPKAVIKNARYYPRFIENNVTHSRVPIWWFPDLKGFIYCDDRTPTVVKEVPAGFTYVDKKCSCTTNLPTGFRISMNLDQGRLNHLINSTNRSDKLYTSDMLTIKNDSTEISIGLSDLSPQYAYLKTPDRTTIWGVTPVEVAAAPATYSNIQFNFDSSVLRTSSYPTLDAVSADLRAKSTKTIELNGFVSLDEKTTAAHAMALSKDRANSVKTYLVNSGVEARRIKIRAFGETKPIADNSTEEGRVQNRRVEFEQK